MIDIMESDLLISAYGLFDVDLKILPKVILRLFDRFLSRVNCYFDLLQLFSATLTYLVIIFQFQFNEA